MTHVNEVNDLIEQIAEEYPKNHQELFGFAIEQAQIVNREFAGTEMPDRELMDWAKRYAVLHNLRLPEAR